MNLGTLKKETVEKLKQMLALLGKKGTFWLECEQASEELKVSDSFSVQLKTPVGVHYEFKPAGLSISMTQRPLVKFKGSNLFSKYINSIHITEDKINIDLGWLNADFDLE